MSGAETIACGCVPCNTAPATQHLQHSTCNTAPATQHLQTALRSVWRRGLVKAGRRSSAGVATDRRPAVASRPLDPMLDPERRPVGERGGLSWPSSALSRCRDGPIHSHPALPGMTTHQPFRASPFRPRVGLASEISHSILPVSRIHFLPHPYLPVDMREAHPELHDRQAGATPYDCPCQLRTGRIWNARVSGPAGVPRGMMCHRQGRCVSLARVFYDTRTLRATYPPIHPP
jgi:hypothetical protein